MTPVGRANGHMIGRKMRRISKDGRGRQSGQQPRPSCDFSIEPDGLVVPADQTSFGGRYVSGCRVRLASGF